jgi:DNA-binding IclR family transcriptional regulator
MRGLAEASGESVAFHVPSGSDRVCLYRIESTQALRYAVQVGSVLPMGAGSGGRVLAAHLGGTDAVHADIRARGYHHSDGERDPQVAGVSVPVFRAGGQIAGALTIAGPRQRLTPARVAAILPRLKAAGAAVTGALGGVAAP